MVKKQLKLAMNITYEKTIPLPKLQRLFYY